VTFFRGSARLEVEVRKMGFLDDSRVPVEVKRDVARVQVGDFFVPAPDAHGRLVWPGPDGASVSPHAALGHGRTDREIIARLAPLENRTVIMVSDMAGAMCGLSDTSANEAANHPTTYFRKGG